MGQDYVRTIGDSYRKPKLRPAQTGANQIKMLLLFPQISVCRLEADSTKIVGSIYQRGSHTKIGHNRVDGWSVRFALGSTTATKQFPIRRIILCPGVHEQCSTVLVVGDSWIGR